MAPYPPGEEALSAACCPARRDMAAQARTVLEARTILKLAKLDKCIIKGKLRIELQ